MTNNTKIPASFIILTIIKVAVVLTILGFVIAKLYATVSEHANSYLAVGVIAGSIIAAVLIAWRRK